MIHITVLLSTIYLESNCLLILINIPMHYRYIFTKQKPEILLVRNCKFCLFLIIIWIRQNSTKTIEYICIILSVTIIYSK